MIFSTVAPARLFRTMSSSILLVAFIFLMDCPVACALHKGDITCCCHSCGVILKKKMYEKSAGGPADANVAWCGAWLPGAVWFGSTHVYQTLYVGKTVICPFLTTVKLQL